MKRKAWAILLLVVVFVATMTGCGSNNEPSNDSDTETVNESITLVNEAAIPDFDPVNWYITSQSTLFCNVYSTLIDVIVEDDQSIVCRPNLAKSWELSDDGLTLTFHLNENAKYSDGNKVTAEDVKTCFERQQTNPYTMSNVAMIDSIDVPDENTVVFNLAYEWPSAPNCWYMVAIYEVKLYDSDKESYIKSPVGSGPYTLTDLNETEGTMTLTLKDDWWGDEKPTIKTVYVRTITDPSTRVISLQKGEISATTLQGSNLKLVEEDKNLTMKEGLSQVPSQLLVNKSVAPYDNDKVREAISYAINYEEIRNATCAGYVSSKDSTIVFATPEMGIPDGVRQYTYDPEKAKQLIAESGLEVPIDGGELIGGSDNGSSAMIQQYLSTIGIQVSIPSYETNAFVQMLMEGRFGLAITSGAGGQSAFENLRNYYGTGQPYNFNRFSNSDVDALIDKMQHSHSQEETVEYLVEALNIIVNENTNFNLGIPALYVVYRNSYEVPPVWNGIDMIRVR